MVMSEEKAIEPTEWFCREHNFSFNKKELAVKHVEDHHNFIQPGFHLDTNRESRKETVQRVLKQWDSDVSKYGIIHHSNSDWLVILTEEIGEVAKEICDLDIDKKLSNYQNLQTKEHLQNELVDVLSSGFAWLEQLRKSKNDSSRKTEEENQ